MSIPQILDDDEGEQHRRGRHFVAEGRVVGLGNLGQLSEGFAARSSRRRPGLRRGARGLEQHDRPPPALIVRPTGTDDVVAARFAREQELVVAVRCGGDSIPASRPATTAS